MATVTIRNLDDRILKKLKARAKANKRSLQAELHELLTNVVKENEQMRRFRAKAQRIAAMTPDVPQTDSALLHVIRNEESLNQIREYIETNPQRWQFDRENPSAVPADRGAGFKPAPTSIDANPGGVPPDRP